MSHRPPAAPLGPHPSPDAASSNMRLDLAVPDDLDPILIDDALGDNLVAPHGGPEFGPQGPVDAAQDQDADADDGEDVVRVPVGPEVPVGRRDEGHDGEEGVAEQEDDDDGQPGAPGRVPRARLLVVQVDEPRRDEAVDPGARVRVQVDDEVVRRPWGRREQDDDGYQPVEEELGVDCQLIS